jgi:hypothetical protein
MSKPIPKEIKEQVLSRIKNDGVTGKAAADEAGISSKTVYGWLADTTVSEPGILELNKLRRENEGLYALIGRLTAELDKAKKGRLPR